MISGSASSAAEAPIWGWEPAPRPWVMTVPIWMRRVAALCMSAWASVLATTNSTPSSRDSIMLLTALPPAPPTPKTVILGFSSARSGTVRLMVIADVPLEHFPRGHLGFAIDNKRLTGPYQEREFSRFLEFRDGSDQKLSLIHLPTLSR